MRLLKWLLGIVVTLVVLVVAAVALLPLWFDPNDHRERIVAAVEDTTGRSFQLDGEIGWSLFPRLSLTAGPARLGNDPAFEGEDFLAAREVSAALDVLPLLSRQVRIGEVVLDGVTIDLVVDRTGRGNWASLQERMAGTAEAPATPDPGGPGVDLAVEGVRLVDARISYRDLGSELAAVLDDLTIAIAPVSAGATTEIEVATGYRVDSLAGSFEASLSADGLLSEAGPRIVLRELTLENGEGLPLNVTVASPATIDLATGEADLPGLTVASGQARMTLSAAATGLTTTPAFEGRVEVPDFALGAWLRESGLYAEATADPDALSRFGAKTGFAYGDGVVRLRGIEGRLDDSTLTGEVTVDEVVRFDLALDDINVDRYLPPPSDAPEQPQTAPPSELAFGRLDGSVRLGRLVVAGLEATDITVRVNADEEGLRLAPITGALYGGAVDAALSLGAAGGRSPATVSLSVDGVQAGGLLGAWMAKPVMTGTGTLAVQLAMDDAFALEPLRGLGGDLQFRFADGAIFGINVFGSLRQALALVGQGDPAALSEGDRATDFSSFEFAGRVDRGVLETTTFALASPYLRVGGNGTVDLAEGTLAYRLEPVLLGTPDGAGSELAQLEGTRVPIELSGPLADPSIRLDAASALLSGQRQRLQDKLGEKLGLDSDGEEDGGKAALGGLLRGALDRNRDRGDDKDDSDDGDGGGK